MKKRWIGVLLIGISVGWGMGMLWHSYMHPEIGQDVAPSATFAVFQQGDHGETGNWYRVEGEFATPPSPGSILQRFWDNMNSAAAIPDSTAPSTFASTNASPANTKVPGKSIDKKGLL